MIKIAASILAADFSKLAAEIDSARRGGADYIHFDVMDGVFVPNISFGIPVLRSLRKTADMPFDVHLMIDKPIRYVEAFADAGADIITVHLEADSAENIDKTIDMIHALGKKAGLSVKPNTPVSALYPYIKKLDLALIMTVEPGFGGQSFMRDMLPKIAELREYISKNGYDCDIEVDGGILPETSALSKAHGANVLVSGSCIFENSDYNEQIEKLRNA